MIPPEQVDGSRSKAIHIPIDAVNPLIRGLEYIPDYISPEREKQLLDTIDRHEWDTSLRRRTQHYGYRYDYRARTVTPSMFLGPLPDWAQSLPKKATLGYGLVANPGDLSMASRP